MKYENLYGKPTSVAQNYNGFTPPESNFLEFGLDSNGKSIILSQSVLNTQEAVSSDMNEMMQRIYTHNWFYRLHANLDIFSEGYRNEQAILLIVQRRGGVFATIWNTEKQRHLCNN